MKPGRELDALVAEKVLGKKVCSCTNQQIEDHIEREGVRSIWCRFGSRGSCNACGRHYIHSREYSTDIAAAWEVVEKLKPNFDMALETHFDCWLCEFGNNPYRRGIGVTAPHAICVAALQAIGHRF